MNNIVFRLIKEMV